MTFLLPAGRLLSLQPIQISLQTGKTIPKSPIDQRSNDRRFEFIDENGLAEPRVCAFGSRQSRSAKNRPRRFLRNEANFPGVGEAELRARKPVTKLREILAGLRGGGEAEDC